MKTHHSFKTQCLIGRLLVILTCAGGALADDVVSLSTISTADLNDVAYHEHFFIAVGDQGTIKRSGNLQQWDDCSAAGVLSDLCSIAYGNGTWVVAGKSGTLMTSNNNGAEWISVPSGVTADIEAVTYGNGRFVAVGGGNIIVSSDRAQTWSPMVNPSSKDPSDVSFGSGVFVAALSPGGDAVLTSVNGETWSELSIGVTLSGSIDFAGDRFFASAIVSTGTPLTFSTYATSVDGSAWTLVDTGVPDLMNLFTSDAATGNGETILRGEFNVVVLPGGRMQTAQNILVHEPAGTWHFTPVCEDRLNALTFGFGNFLAVGANGTAAVIRPSNPGEGVTTPHFSQAFSTEEILMNSRSRAEFVESLLGWLGSGFLQPGVAYDPKLGTTYDGHRIDACSGELLGARRTSSAASKEALDVTILALAIKGNRYAQMAVSRGNPMDAPDRAAQRLAEKIATYRKFNQEYPGFGGFLPWFTNTANGIRPAEDPDDPARDWGERVPGLDNGQLAFALILAEAEARRKGRSELADAIRAQVNLMIRNAVRIFFDYSEGKVRAEAILADNQLPPEDIMQSYSSGGGYFLADPYEGELMVFFISLYARGYLSPSAIDQIWNSKVRSVQTLASSQGPISVEQGHWFSAHEMWARLQFPYLDHPLAARIFRNGERARTWHSADAAFPGLFASVNPPVEGNGTAPYVSNLGIPGAISTVGDVRQDIVSPYAAFPVILADTPTGLAWLDLMLDGPRMQSPFGIADSISVQGDKTAPLVTWDVNGLVLLSLLIAEEYRSEGRHPLSPRLEEVGLLDDALLLIDGEFSEAFDAETLEGEDIPFATPAVSVPQAVADFDPAACPLGEVLAGTPFQAGGPLDEAWNFTAGTLKISHAADGFLFNELRHVDVAQHPFLTFEALTGGADFFVEIKNPAGHSVTTERVLIALPDTGGVFSQLTVNLANILRSDVDTTAAVFVLAGPSGAARFTSIRFASVMPGVSTLLGWNGMYFSSGEDDVGNVLERPVFFGGGDLWKQYSFNNRQLDLPGVSGFLGIRHLYVDIAANPIVTFDVLTPGQRVFLEIKNRQDELVSEGKILVEFPDTKGVFEKFSINVARFLATGDNVVQLLVLSDPIGSSVFREISYGADIPEDAVGLEWDGRRFILEVVLPDIPNTPFLNLLPVMNFVPDNRINFEHEADITFLPGGGFIWGYLPEHVGAATANTDLDQNAWFDMVYSTTGDASVQLELKNMRPDGTQEGLIGQTGNPFPKIRLHLGNTNGHMRLGRFDLSSVLTEGVHDRIARIMAFSDPAGGEIHIGAFGLSADYPDGAPRIGIRREGGEIRVYWYGEGNLERADSPEGPWQPITTSTSVHTEPIAGRRFFRIHQP